MTEVAGALIQHEGGIYISVPEEVKWQKAPRLLFNMGAEFNLPWVSRAKEVAGPHILQERGIKLT